MHAISKLKDIVATLRSPNGCPWDKEQTFQSLIPCIIEEAYELVDAIESQDTQHIIEELGDVLLHVIMICHIATETSLFNLDIIADQASSKMIRRHPHVFGNKTASTVTDVLSHWEAAKDQETPHASSIKDIPNLPALLKAEKIQKKASKSGFDWPTIDGAIQKIHEELKEFEETLTQNNKTHREEEAGDLLFAVVNVLRKQDINAEEALRKANNKFIKRYTHMESLHDDFQSLSLEEKESLWQQVKSLG